MMYLFLLFSSCRPELILTVVDGLDIKVPRNVTGFLNEQQNARFLECRYREARNFLQVSYNKCKINQIQKISLTENVIFIFRRSCLFGVTALSRGLLTSSGGFSQKC